MNVVVAMEEEIRWPAEWESHERCWVGWPERADVWPNGGKEAKQAMVEVAKAIANEGLEHVTLFASPRSVGEAAGAVSAAGLDGVVRVSALELDDIWLRDTGPIVVRRTAGGATSLLGLDFAFNGWGGKFPPWTKDAEAAAGILELEGLAREDCRDFVLEGGSVHGDGVGTVLATETCLLNENRNPGLGRDGVERELRRRLGARKVVWLPRGIVWDGDTDGHVDNFACFAGPGRVLLSWCECGEGPGVCAQCSSCEEAEAVLERETDADGHVFHVTRVPLPEIQRYTEGEAAAIEGGSRAPGEPLCCSYLNFYVSNAAVVMPGFGCPRSDARAREVVERAFSPGRKVVQLGVGRTLALGGGNIHCLTMQKPEL